MYTLCSYTIEASFISSVLRIVLIFIFRFFPLWITSQLDSVFVSFLFFLVYSVYQRCFVSFGFLFVCSGCHTRTRTWRSKTCYSSNLLFSINFSAIHASAHVSFSMLLKSLRRHSICTTKKMEFLIWFYCEFLHVTRIQKWKTN